MRAHTNDYQSYIVHFDEEINTFVAEKIVYS